MLQFIGMSSPDKTGAPGSRCKAWAALGSRRLYMFTVTGGRSAAHAATQQ